MDWEIDWLKMTLKERVKGWFKKKDAIQGFTTWEKDPVVITSVEISERELSAELDTLVDKDAVEGKEYVANLEDIIAEFNIDVPDKKAIWGGKETIAFKKWKNDHNF